MSRRGRLPGRPLKLGLAAVLGVGAALIVACGGSSKLIPAQNASQLTTDFDLVASAVSAGNCGQTLTTALDQTRTDLAALPPSIDPRLASAIQAGAAKLTSRAAVECAQQQTTTTATTPTTTTTTPTTTNTTPTTTTPTTTNTTPTTTTPTTTNTTPTTTTPTTSTPTDTTPTTTTPAPDNGGGTPAPGGGSTGGATGGASGGTPGGGGA